MTNTGKKTLIAALLGATLLTSFAGVSYAAGPSAKGGMNEMRGGMGPGAFGAAPMGQLDFATLDADGNGAITQEDLDALAAERFAEVDLNGDGTLDASEVAAQMTARIEERGLDSRTQGAVEWTPTIDEDRVAWMAEGVVLRMDDNDDGVLSIEEVTPDGDRAGKMLARLDTDGDGAVSQEEFDAAVAKMAERGQPRKGGHPGKGGKQGG